jgi:hypothetical protein
MGGNTQHKNLQDLHFQILSTDSNTDIFNYALTDNLPLCFAFHNNPENQPLLNLNLISIPVNSVSLV